MPKNASRRARLSIAATVATVVAGGLAFVSAPSGVAFAACPQIITPGCGPTPSPSASTASPSPTPTPTSTAPAGVIVGADGWITYTDLRSDSLGLITPTTQTVSGAFDADGDCDISGTGTLDSSAAAVYEEETGYNPTTCQERILVGGLTSAASASLADPADDANTASGTDAGAAVTSDLVTPDTTSYSSAYEKTSWIDPLHITITSLTTNLRWPLHGAGGTLTGRNNPYEFKYDGWSNSGTSAVHFTTLSGNTGWSVHASEEFTNSDFASLVYGVFGVAGWLSCGAPLTATAHFWHSVTVTGYRSGSRGWAWSDKKSGACSNLVHHGQWNNFGWSS